MITVAKRPEYHCLKVCRELAMVWPLDFCHEFEIARGQQVSEDVRNDASSDGQSKVIILPDVERLREHLILLYQIPEKSAEQESHQRSDQVGAFVAVVILIIQLMTAEHGEDEAMDHDADVGKDIFLQNFRAGFVSRLKFSATFFAISRELTLTTVISLTQRIIT